MKYLLVLLLSSSIALAGLKPLDEEELAQMMPTAFVFETHEYLYENRPLLEYTHLRMLELLYSSLQYILPPHMMFVFEYVIAQDKLYLVFSTDDKALSIDLIFLLDHDPKIFVHMHPCDLMALLTDRPNFNGTVGFYRPRETQGPAPCAAPFRQ